MPHSFFTPYAHSKARQTVCPPVARTSPEVPKSKCLKRRLVCHVMDGRAQDEEDEEEYGEDFDDDNGDF